MTDGTVSLGQLESHLWKAANILRGPVGAADFKTPVFPLLFFKRISDAHDEEYQAALEESGGDDEYALFPQNYRFQIPIRCHWRDVRRKLIEADLIECVLGLGPNLFYNSSMEACVVICRSAKPKQRRNKILFINAINEVTRERAQSFLTDGHIERIVAAYRNFADEHGLARVASLEEIRAKDGNLSIPLYVAAAAGVEQERASYQAGGLDAALTNWLESSQQARAALSALLADMPRSRKP